MLNNKALYFVIGLSIINLSGLGYVYMQGEQQNKMFESRVMQAMQDNGREVIEILQNTQPKRDDRKVANAFLRYTKNVDFPTLGAKNGDVIIYEFMDYQCGYCKAMYKNLNTIKETDKNIMVKLIEYPILGKASQLASAVALAAQEQGKYEAYHDVMMTYRGRLNEDIIFDKAKSIGLDMDAVQKYLKSGKAETIIQQNLSYGKLVGATGTPFMIVFGKKNSKIIGGFVKKDALENVLNRLRK